jgi:hypothetical protein
MNNSGITQNFNSIKVDNVTESTYKKGIFQAQLRQTVETVYPSQRVGNSESDGLYDVSAFNLPEGQKYSSDRLCWIHVPEGTNVAKVEALLKANPKAKIWRKISNNVMDVLTEEQKGAISAGITTIENLETSLIVKDKDGAVVGDVPQYRQYFFSKDGSKSDVDLRSTVSASVKAAQEEIHA